MDRPGSGSGSGSTTRRDDSWSDSATSALIDAWGERYLRQNRGILRLKDWKEIADAVNAVNAVDGAGDEKPPRIWSDAQCKNRVDTLKKKYKLERSKPSPSSWPFFHRLEFLIGEATAVAGDGGGGAKKTKKSKPVIAPVKAPVEGGDGDGDGYGGVAGGELARALVRLGEVYERVERSKQRVVLELEKQRMEFSKEIEFERLNMFMEAQVEMARANIKRAKLASASASASGEI